MLSNLCQPGILAPLAAFGCALGFRLRPGIDPATALLQLQEKFDPASGVAGLGEPLLRSLGRTIPGLRTIPALSGPGHAVPSTQHALWIFVTGADRSTVFDRTAGIVRLLEQAFELADCQDTFQYRNGRDLTGYEDGTENPSAEDSVAVALLPEQDGWMAGSSFVAVQRWSHDLHSFAAHPGEQRDLMMGRRHSDNAEIDDAPPSSHVKRSAQESFEPAAFLVRRSMPWASGSAQGLEFIAYARSPDAFEQILRRMLGLEDGIADALFRFSRPLTGGYYWCPPVKSGRLHVDILLDR